MDLNAKKTKLSDDAALYGSREEKTEKQKWSEMTGKQRFIYFWDYYLLKLIAITAGVAIVISIFYTALKPKPKAVLQIASVGFVMTDEMVQTAVDDMTQILELDIKKQIVQLTADYPLASQDRKTIDRLSIFYMVGELDCVILPMSELELYSSYGWFMSPENLSEDEEFYELIKDRLIELPVYDENGDLVEGQTRIAGILLTGSKLFEQSLSSQTITLAIPETNKKQEATVKFIEYLLN